MSDAGIPHAPAAAPSRAKRAASNLRGPLLAAGVSAAFVLAITAAATWVAHNHLLDAAQTRFDAQATHVTADLRRELALCTQVLRGASGFVAAQQGSPPGALSSDAWERYITHLALEDTPPCVRTLGYAQARKATGDEALAQVVLMWPPRADGAGRELGAQPETREALRRAADTGDIALTVRAASRGFEAQSSGGSGRARIDLYLPVYHVTPEPLAPASRRAALDGFVIAQLDTEYLFASVAARIPHIDMHVASTTPDFALYPPGSAPAAGRPTSALFERAETFEFGGQAFSLDYRTNDPALSASADIGSSAFVTAGCVAALIGGVSAFLFARRRGKTLAEAGVARSLSSLSEARMMAIVRASSEAIIIINEAQHIVIFNPMAEKIFRCSAMEAIGSTLDRFIPERYRAGHRQHVEQFGATTVSERQMGRQRLLTALRADGEEFPMEASISQISDGQRKFYTAMLRDVTERVRAENQLKESREELRKLSANLQNVREEEKTRIARELHDDLGQQLTALKMDLSAVQQTLEGASSVPSNVTVQLHSMRRLIDSTVGSVRRIAADLRPVMLDDLGLMPAIEWLLNDFTTRYGIEIDRQIDTGDMLFSRNGATTIFRIVQEALTNVVRHAEATRVSITLTAEGDQYLLRIADNGRGAMPEDTEGRREKSFGLLGIRERAHILGGSVSIKTTAKRGFAITVILPLAAIQQEEALP